MLDSEGEIRAAFNAGDLESAVTQSVACYGPEILGWMVTSTGELALAEDAFSKSIEDLWTSFSSFRWDCSMRTWMYLLARNALFRIRRSDKVHVELAHAVPAYIAALTRSDTRPWLRTDVKDGFRDLRDSLDETSRELLILRVDRGMKWQEIALVLGESGDPDQAAARVRKRFSLLKAELRRRALESGLIQ